MRLDKACLALGLAIAAAMPAGAAELNYGGRGLKDHGHYGVPVPAPVPIQETFRWYLRADLGMGIIDDPSITERGLLYGLDSLAPFGTQSSWFQSDFDSFFMGGIGAGLYLTPRLRGDITFDWRTKSEATADGNYVYRQTPGTPLSNIVRGTVREHTEVHGSVGLLNLYYDLTDRGPFTPYIGVGAGFVVRHVDRHHTTTELIFDNTNALIMSRGFADFGKSSNIAAAGAATAGVSYSVSTGMLIDLNYRFTYLGSVESQTLISGMASRLTIGDTYEHALRAGLRWNVW